MKRTLLLVLLALFANAGLGQPTCDSIKSYRVFFGNGINTTKADAHNDLYRLRTAVGTSLNGQRIAYDLAYNTTGGFLIDLWQSSNQKLSESQLEFWFWISNRRFSPDWLTDYAQSSLIHLLSTYVPNATDVALHVNQYANALLAGEKVLVVSHSQGNFYVNEAKQILENSTPAPPLRSFGIFGVATPASNVGGEGGPYYTNDQDIISFVPGALEPNWPLRFAATKQIADLWPIAAHSFAQTYLSSVYDIRPALIQGIQARLEDLEDPLPDCPAPPPATEFKTYLPAMLAGSSVAVTACRNVVNPPPGALTVDSSGNIVGSGCFSAVQLTGKARYYFTQWNYEYCRGACPIGIQIAPDAGYFKMNQAGTNVTLFQLDPQGPLSSSEYPYFGSQSRLSVPEPWAIDIADRMAGWVRLIANQPCAMSYSTPPATLGPLDHHIELTGGVVSIKRGTQLVASSPLSSFEELFAERFEGRTRYPQSGLLSVEANNALGQLFRIDGNLATSPMTFSLNAPFVDTNGNTVVPTCRNAIGPLGLY